MIQHITENMRTRRKASTDTVSKTTDLPLPDKEAVDSGEPVLKKPKKADRAKSQQKKEAKEKPKR